MLSIARPVVRRMVSRDHLLIGGIAFRLIVFVVALATWIMMARHRWDVAEQIAISLVVLTGFVSLTSAIRQIVDAARGQSGRAGAGSSFTATDRDGLVAHEIDDPEVLASVLVTQVDAAAGSLTLADATRLLVPRVGPLPLSRVQGSIDVLVRHQLCVPDFDEETGQRCWQIAGTRPLHGPSRREVTYAQ